MKDPNTQLGILLDHSAALGSSFGHGTPGSDLVVEGKPNDQGVFLKAFLDLDHGLLVHIAVIMDGSLGETRYDLLDGGNVRASEACIDGKLDEVDLQFEDNAAVCVVLASDGYPESYEKGFAISGFENFESKDGYYVFHAGTKQTKEGIVTNGGRVLGVTAKGEDLRKARANAYEATNWIEFENKYMRNDIGKAIDEQ